MGIVIKAIKDNMADSKIKTSKKVKSEMKSIKEGFEIFSKEQVEESRSSAYCYVL